MRRRGPWRHRWAGLAAGIPLRRSLQSGRGASGARASKSLHCFPRNIGASPAQWPRRAKWSHDWRAFRWSGCGEWRLAVPPATSGVLAEKPQTPRRKGTECEIPCSGRRLRRQRQPSRRSRPSAAGSDDRSSRAANSGATCATAPRWEDPLAQASADGGSPRARRRWFDSRSRLRRRLRRRRLRSRQVRPILGRQWLHSSTASSSF